jgi:hypothetical protein
VRALDEEMQPLADTIRTADVTSIAGLRAKTLVAIWDYQPLGSRHQGGFDFENEETHRSLFHGAAAATGLSEIVSAIDMRLQIDAGIKQA